MDIGTALGCAAAGLVGPLWYKFVGVPLFKRMYRSKNWFVKKVLLFQIGNSYQRYTTPETGEAVGDGRGNRR